MSKIYWDKSGGERCFYGHIAQSVKDTRNLTPWRGDFSELIELYKNHCYALPYTREQFRALDETEQKRVKDIGGFVAAQLKDGNRADINATWRDIITIDADAAPADFVERWQSRINRAAIIHGTAKHTPNSPHYRLIIPLDRRIYLDGREGMDKFKYQSIVTELLDLLDLLPYLDEDGQRVEPVDVKASTNLSQLMYWPCCCSDEAPTLYIIEGELLDPERDYPRIRAELRPSAPPIPLQASTEPEQDAQTENHTAVNIADLDAAFAQLIGQPAPISATDTQTQGTHSAPISTTDALSIAIKLTGTQSTEDHLITDPPITGQDAPNVKRITRRGEVEDDTLTAADKAFAQTIFDTRSWRFVPSTRDPKSGDDKFTAAVLRAINATQAAAVAQCYQDCRGHEDLFFNTIYGDLFRHAAGEDFLSTIKRYIDTRPIFEYVLSDAGVLEKLKSGLLCIARGSTKEYKTKRAYMPALAEMLTGEDAIEELNIERQDEATDEEAAEELNPERQDEITAAETGTGEQSTEKPPQRPLLEVLENSGGLLLLYKPTSGSSVYKGHIAYYAFGNTVEGITKIIEVLEARREKARGIAAPAPSPLEGNTRPDTLLSDILTTDGMYTEQLNLFGAE